MRYLLPILLLALLSCNQTDIRPKEYDLKASLSRSGSVSSGFALRFAFTTDQTYDCADYFFNYEVINNSGNKYYEINVAGIEEPIDCVEIRRPATDTVNIIFTENGSYDFTFQNGKEKTTAKLVQTADEWRFEQIEGSAITFTQTSQSRR